MRHLDPEDEERSRRIDVLMHDTDSTFRRWDSPKQTSPARRRSSGWKGVSLAKRVGAIGVALIVLAIATIAFGLIVGPIGWNGLFVVSLITLAVLVLFSMKPLEPKPVEYSEQVPTRTIIRQLESLLVRERTALPAPAARRADAISATLPLLESRLSEIDPLDPLAQDARRLMGKHLPELIERYERIPTTRREDRDGEGNTADDRLMISLDAAREALEEIGQRLVESDRRSFDTQGRFIESRYKDGGGIAGQ